LGDGTTTNNFKARKVTINGNARPIVAIYTNNNYGGQIQDYTTFYAIDDQGDLWAWGDNRLGQIGNGVANATVVSTPTQVGSVALAGKDIVKLSVSANSGVVSVAAIDYQVVQLYTDGVTTVDGQLGLGNTTSPVPTPALAINTNMSSGVIDVIASNNTSNGFIVALKDRRKGVDCR
jgi:hypothetical protein